MDGLIQNIGNEGLLGSLLALSLIAIAWLFRALLAEKDAHRDTAITSARDGFTQQAETNRILDGLVRKLEAR